MRQRFEPAPGFHLTARERHVPEFGQFGGESTERYPKFYLTTGSGFLRYGVFSGTSIGLPVWMALVETDE